ncbi:DUF618-domain-containing protein [Paraphaeosphaeria sporulosa]|uniref:DUF618-domain-containing protein n=1 Tax=Paraphaeosphaeria sporulosa TaxID=1460663 RepID=A0A177C7H9_9PLEO|nr:DUF618-domain-containing protein [Paraphaeosphaeria sporulosa]OAG02728.1 DUF618-domain-containing protein [Paraphaeosphaeria sporulosa]
MAFTEDSLKAKLSSLNETQDSISSVGQWILFHRRHADKIAALWSQRVKESAPNKKLTLIYLANEIVQQSKIRKKEEFLRAFDPIIVGGSTQAYKGSPPDIQSKMRRVFEVWKSRQVFRPQILEELERGLDDVDRTRSNKKPLGQLGGSLFSGSSIPPDLKAVEPFATALQKADLAARPLLTTANQGWEKITNPNAPIPTPPIHAAALGALVRDLAKAENAVADSIKARQALVSGLEKLLETNRTKLAEEATHVSEIKVRKATIETRMREVEAAIMSGLAETSNGASAPLPSFAQVSSSHERPDVEALTPPPVESFTPVGSPTLQATQTPLPDVPDDVFPKMPAHPVEQPMAAAPAGTTTNAIANSEPATAIGAVNTTPGADLLHSLAHARPSEENGVYGQATYKKRKMSRSAAEDEFAAFEGDAAMNGIDSTLGDLI